MFKRTLFFIIAIFISLFYADQALADECWINPPSGYHGIGGSSRVGPYSDYYSALAVNNSKFNGFGSINCTKSRDKTVTPKFKFGAVKFTNNTSRAMTIWVHASPTGSWSETTIRSGAARMFWQTCPCEYWVQWDGNILKGLQKKEKNLDWWGYPHEPSSRDGRPYQFVEGGRVISLVEGTTTPKKYRKRKQTLPMKSSVSGKGSGRLNATYKSATKGQGTFKLTFMPRVKGVIPVVTGNWKMKWIRTIGRKNAPFRKDEWTITTRDMHGMGGGVQTAKVIVKGGVGTAEFWTTQVPGNPGAGRIKISIGIQVSGSNVRLSFSKSY